MENKAKAGIIIVIVLVIIVVAYFYSQGWFTQIIPYFKSFIKVIEGL